MKYANEILKEIEDRGTVDNTNYIIDDGWEDYIRRRKFTNKILNYLLTFLLKRAKVVYREYWTSKQIQYASKFGKLSSGHRTGKG